MTTGPVINPSEVYAAGTAVASLPHKLGTIAYDHLGNKHMFVRADGATANKLNVRVEAGFEANPLTGAGVIFGINATGVTVADNEFYWLQISGVVTAANCKTAVSANLHLGRLADANGDFETVATVDGMAAMALTAEAAGIADVYLFGI